MAKSNRVVRSFDWVGYVLQIKDKEGKVLESYDAEPLMGEEFEFSDYKEGGEIAGVALLLHGFQQRISDALEEAKEVYDRMLEGFWYREREGVTRIAESLIRFVMEAKKIDRDVALKSLQGLSSEMRSKIVEANAARIEKLKQLIEDEKKLAEATDLGDLMG
jgi:predicted TIM-barrel fold metal-dependent hydrolase